MSEAIIILLFIATLITSIVQFNKIKELKEDMSRVEWWKEHYKAQYRAATERRFELAHENLELRETLQKERKK